MTEIRNLRTDDFEAVNRFWRNTPGMGIVEADDNPKGFAQFLRRNPTSCFAAVNGDQIVGTILAGNDGRRGYLYHVAVDPSARMQGIGKRLVDTAIEALRTEGIHKVALVVFKDNEPGNAFWEELGFTTRPDLYYRNRELDS